MKIDRNALNQELSARLANHRGWVGPLQAEKDMRDEKESKRGFCEPFHFYAKSLEEYFPYVLPARSIQVDGSNSFIAERRSRTFGQIGNSECFYVINLPMVVTGDRTRDFAVWTHLMKAIQKEAFGTTKLESKPVASRRLFVLVGANRYRSINPRANERVWDVVENLPPIPGISYRVVCALWGAAPSRRSTSSSSNAPKIYECERSFRLLCALFPWVANGIKENEKRIRKAEVPYRSIRNWNKSHPSTERLLRELASKGQQKVYWCNLDSDTQSLRRKPGQLGLYSNYDFLIQNWKSSHNGADLQLASTGYWSSPNENSLLRIALWLDNRMRATMNQHIPGAAYFPEPNSIFLIPQLELFKKIRYSFGNAKDREDQTLEMRRFINSAKKVGALKLDATLFTGDCPCLVTDPPSRMRPTLESEFEKDLDLFNLKVLQSIKGISQTHLNGQVWSRQVALALPGSKGDTTTLGHCKALYALFDVDTLARIFEADSPYGDNLWDPLRKYNYSDTLEILLNRRHQEWSDNVKRFLETPSSTTCVENEAKARAANLHKLHRQGEDRKIVEKRLAKYIQRAVTAEQSLFKCGLSKEWIARIRQAAYHCGIVFREGLKVWEKLALQLRQARLKSASLSSVVHKTSSSLPTSKSTSTLINQMKELSIQSGNSAASSGFKATTANKPVGTITKIDKKK